MMRRPSLEELRRSVVDPDVKFSTINEPLNEYVADDGERVLVRLKLFGLAKTGMFDPKGDPVYLFNARPDVTTLAH